MKNAATDETTAAHPVTDSAAGTNAERPGEHASAAVDQTDAGNPATPDPAAPKNTGASAEGASAAVQPTAASSAAPERAAAKNTETPAKSASTALEPTAASSAASGPDAAQNTAAPPERASAASVVDGGQADPPHPVDAGSAAASAGRSAGIGPAVLPPVVLADAGELLRALAAPVRIAIVLQLREADRCVHELVDELDVAQPLISQHLRVLKTAGVVRGERRGREVVYRLVDDHLAHIVVDAVAHVQEGK